MLWKVATGFLGIICLVYYAVLCVMLRKWNSTFSRFWLFAGCFCIMVFCLAREKRIQYILLGILMVSGVLLVITGFLILQTVRAEEENYRYVIVLGAHVQGKKVTDSLRRRLEKAAEYVKRHPGTEIIVSGGQGKGEEITEAEAMEEYLVADGIDRERIFKEDRSKTTKENLLFSKKYINDMEAKVAIVSNDFHVYRACCYAEKLGYRNIYPLAASTHPLLFVNYLVRECFAVWRMWLHI